MKINTKTLQDFGIFAAGVAILLIATKKLATIEEILTILAIIIATKLIVHGLRNLNVFK